MAEVDLAIGGRHYTIACRDGGEDHLRNLAMRVDAKVGEARSAVGTANEVRQLLFAALLLADDLDQAPPVPHASAATSSEAPADDPHMARVLNDLALRVEAIAEALEHGGPAS
jgi:cell division protein ZapA